MRHQKQLEEQTQPLRAGLDSRFRESKTSKKQSSSSSNAESFESADLFQIDVDLFDLVSKRSTNDYQAAPKPTPAAASESSASTAESASIAFFTGGQSQSFGRPKLLSSFIQSENDRCHLVSIYIAHIGHQLVA